MPSDPDIIAFLASWAESYAKHQDIFKKEISELLVEDNIVHATKGEKEDRYVPVSPPWDIPSIEKLVEGANRVFLVSLNNKENLRELISIWQQLVSHKNIRVIMVNPFSVQDSKWIVSPYMHHRYTDSDALEKGLKALAKTVENLPEEKALKRIRKELKH